MMEVVLPHFQIGVASVSIGIAGAAFEKITARVGARKYEHAGGAALASIPRVQFLVAEMAIELNSARAYLAETIRKALAGDPAAMIDVLGVKAKAAEACLERGVARDDARRRLGFRPARRAGAQLPRRAGGRR